MAGRKPSVDDLGVDLDKLSWRRSGTGSGAFEVAVIDQSGSRWTLLRVAEDPAQRVLVYSEHEWACFLDGAKRGEFDDVAP